MAELLSLSLSYQLPAIDIVDGKLQRIKVVEVKKVSQTLDFFADTRTFEDDIEITSFCEFNGTERRNKKSEGHSYYNKNIIAYLRVKGFSCDQKTYQLTRLKNYINRGFYLRRDNYITKLPLFCAKLYPQENWYERDVYFTTADRGEDYLENADLLRRCFIFTCLSRYNHCLSFDGSDGRFYKNELCFDDGTIASEDLKKFDLQPEDKELIDEWKKVL